MAKTTDAHDINQISPMILQSSAAWFRKVLSGEKPSEYRGYNENWIKRFDRHFKTCGLMQEDPSEYAYPTDPGGALHAFFTFRNGTGISVPSFTAWCSLYVGRCDPEWGDRPNARYFVISPIWIRDIASLRYDMAVSKKLLGMDEEGTISPDEAFLALYKNDIRIIEETVSACAETKRSSNPIRSCIPKSDVLLMHHAMWSRIAVAYRNGESDANIKAKSARGSCNNAAGSALRHWYDCWLCAKAAQDCEECLVRWATEEREDYPCTADDSPYAAYLTASENAAVLHARISLHPENPILQKDYGRITKRCARLAHKISILPERKKIQK